MVADQHAEELLRGGVRILDGKPPAAGLVLNVGGELGDDPRRPCLVDRPAQLRKTRRLADDEPVQRERGRP